MNIILFLAAIAGAVTGYLGIDVLLAGASVVSELFINLLKLISLPIIFLSVVSTLSGMQGLGEVRQLGARVLRYTLLTTMIAATVALTAFLVIDPVSGGIPQNGAVVEAGLSSESTGYLSYLMSIVPSGIFQPFIEGNVIGVLFLALLLSAAILALPSEQKDLLHTFFSALFSAVMKVTSFILQLMPAGVWAFVTLFVAQVLKGEFALRSLMLYLACVLTANVVQALIVLPLFLKLRGIAPFRTLRSMMPALVVAFFSKSSSAALPMAMRCAEENLNLSRRVSRFSFPLCTTINMNACAGFILITVLYVSMSHGVVFSPLEMVSWIFIATLAAVGNAGVPMGCYFLSSAFLAAMGVPLHILGAILPAYTLVDMLESAINVWSDACVAAVVDREVAVAEAFIKEKAEGGDLLPGRTMGG